MKIPLLLVVIAVFLGCDYDSGWAAKARRDATYKDLNRIILGAEEIKNTTGKYPETLEEITKHSEFEIRQEDLWGRMYHYEIINNKPRVFTYGKDGISGGIGENEDFILHSS